MAKQFAGFTPDQLGKIDPSLQGMQSDEQQKLIAANPALAARVGKMAEMAQQRIGMAQGGYAKKGYAVGGVASYVAGAVPSAFNDAGMAAKERFNRANMTEVDAAGQAPTTSPVRSLLDPSTMQQSPRSNQYQDLQGAVDNFNAAQQQNMAPATSGQQQNIARANAAFQTQQQMSQGQQMPSESERQFQQDMQTRYQNFEQSNRGALDAARTAGEAIHNKVLAEFGFKNGIEANNASDDIRRAMSAAISEAQRNDPSIQSVISLQRDFEQTLPQYNPNQPQNQFQGTMPTSNTQSPQSDAQINLDTAQKGVADAQTRLQEAIAAQQAAPEDSAKAEAVGKAQAAVDAAQQNLSSTQSSFSTTEVPTSAEYAAKAANDPGSLVTKPDVATISDEDRAAGTIDPTTGQITTPVEQTSTVTADTAPGVQAPDKIEAVTYEPLAATAGVEAVMDRLSAATGKPSDQALADAATMDPQELASLGLSPAQIAEAQTVKAPDARTIQEGELVSGPTVDMDRVKKEINFEAATGAPSTDATVQGQLTGLMQQFEGKEPPAWAAGAMRAAGAAMAARGLSASSMAGQAVVQAAMESAIPIAQQDAATFAKFESQNLTNKQQAAMFAAEKRAEFLGMEFDQAFQTRVANAAKISDIANMNFTAEQTIALENARLAQSVDLANLDAANAKVLADAAAMTQVDVTNLSNRQQAAVQQANAFLQMDVQNLSNEQQTATFKAQQIANALLSDQAAENAARQFNASSQTQTDQFFANLASTIAMHNNDQANIMNRFNAGEANVTLRANADRRSRREEFLANNALAVAQSNATWFQNIATTETAALNQANRDEAMATNEFTMTAYNNAVQKERDLLDYAWRGTESQVERDLRVQLQAMQNSMDDKRIQAELDRAKGSAAGTLFAKITDAIIDRVI